MKKFLLISLFISCLIQPLYAAHVRGGEMYYVYDSVNSTPTMARYIVTLKLYIDCNSQGGQVEGTAPFTVFDRSTNAQIRNIIVDLTKDERITYDPSSNPCISNPPSDVCYRLRYFTTTIDLPVSAAGYTITYQRCCRIENIQNMPNRSNDYGATYMCTIPGTVNGVTKPAYKNSSPQFNPHDAVAICYGSNFTFDFSANDPDGDSVVYRLCNAYNGGGPGSASPNCYTCAQPNPAAPPPYNSIPYRSPYSGSNPLGIDVEINPRTGLLSGIAPSTEGQYVVTACAYEYRDKVLINIHRKDIHIRVSDCIPLKALLKPDYHYCDDFMVTFRNEQVNPANSMYIWSYGDGTKSDTTMDVEGRMMHKFRDTGTYVIKLKVILAGQCVDSTTTLAKVYPGFFPNFSITGTCVLKPIQFNDLTTSQWGYSNKWTWNFGDETTIGDTSHSKAPSWQYSSIGQKPVTLIVESNNGCIDTLTLNADVRDKPPITLAFKDTLICSNQNVQDTLQLHASGNGIFTWSPQNRITRANTPDPLVFPQTTTTYKVQLDENGCVSEDFVRVRVVGFVTLDAGPNDTICLSDTLQLLPATDGLKFTWTSNPSPSPINDIHAKNPLVAPTDQFTTYSVLAEIGKCSARDNLQVKTVPYPTAKAGDDAIICYDDTTRLNASMIGYTFQWSPFNTLSDRTVLDPFAYPRITTDYVLTVRDTLGCPKPKRDTVRVIVRDELFAFAGNDTAVVINEPLHLNGRGADFYEWTPSLYLNRNDISNPIANLPVNHQYQLRVYTAEGCFDLDTINIRVFHTSPEIFVPNAFRPDGNQNNLLRPLPVGITRIEYFRVYNRWGQMVFQTVQHGAGWDGKLGGKPQDSGMYVWEVRGKDFTGKTVVKKGVAYLLR
ncbi:PKD domain-containing protein [Paraflavitalea sp. CAU 1676]|uniref:PKD domain-containing protein n=1 Tax=Paraflavitalea sp. CAU 1676 TaxID=3032598 RepID=UPI0023DC51FB|nr:PKD domain-containing protein [Paraflavitalea sp. CAU 1676]MDF2192234.1 PKD domain-containing protein [Paraflavitalea sp. CAU 1676]